MAGAVEELLKKRAELTEQRQALEKEIKQIDSDVAAIDQVASLFDPSILPTVGPRKRAPAGRSPSSGESLSAIVLKMIREAKESISTAACSAAIARDKGLSEDDAKSDFGNPLEPGEARTRKAARNCRRAQEPLGDRSLDLSQGSHTKSGGLLPCQ